MTDGGVITERHMFAQLIAADSSFGAVWESFCEEWKGEARLPLYLAMSDVAQHLVRQLEHGETDRFDAVFAVVGRWHSEGNAAVRELATIGLLEDLQNENLYRTARPADFEPCLTADSRRHWMELHRFWSAKDSSRRSSSTE